MFFCLPLGLLSTLWPLDREEQSEYELWVTVTDGQLSSVTPVFVTVSDVNDNAPEFLEDLYRVIVPARSKSRKREALFRVGPAGPPPPPVGSFLEQTSPDGVL